MEGNDIIIVEDEAITAKEIEQLLGEMGYRVPTIVKTGEEALEAVEEHRPDLVLMDIQLQGDIDGIEAAKRIRRDYATPVVYLTANADQETVQRARQSKAFGYIVKPFHKEELRANVEIALSTYQEEQQVEQRLEEVSEMLDNIDDAIATVNTNGRVTYMNATAQAYANPDPQADNPRDVETLFRVVDPSSGERVTTDHPVRQVLGGGAVKPGTEVTLRTRNGQHHRVHIITASLIQRDGQTVGAVWAFGPAGVSGPGGVTEGAAADASGDAARERLELIESLLKELGMSEEQIDTAIERMRARQRS